jgi:Ca2+-binding RTX toxin-like protein
MTLTIAENTTQPVFLVDGEDVRILQNVTASGGLTIQSLVNNSLNATQIVNEGSIAGARVGIGMDDMSYGHVIIINSGTISGQYSAFTANSIEGPQSSLDLSNTGQISGSLNLDCGSDKINNSDGIIIGDIYFDGIGEQVGGDDLLINRNGHITGNIKFYIGKNICNNMDGQIDGSVDCASGNDRFLNENGKVNGNVNLRGGANFVDNRYGYISGDVMLGNGDDLMDNRNGQVVGLISMGGGADTFIASNRRETVDGGGDADTLDFSSGGGLVIALDGSVANTGAAVNDVYENFENVAGARFGADRLIGNGARNTLYGLGGADTLSGGLGADWLVGGRGHDVLTGGAGNDRFQFNATNQGGDKISDFTNMAGNNDAIVVMASQFGFGWTVGDLAPYRFRARTDNVAQDSNDRFIFRTTDKTLWFDANGDADGGEVLIADLQNSASNLTAYDILLI